jgi:hypothetical protein
MFCSVDMHMVHNMNMVLQKLREQLKSLEEELHKTPVTLEELKQVLNIINTIKSTSMNMELRYVDLEERFRYVSSTPSGHTPVPFAVLLCWCHKYCSHELCHCADATLAAPRRCTMILMARTLLPFAEVLCS